MTTYKNIHGKRVKTFATDLDNKQAEGQIFYQDTANEFKTAVASAAWSSTGPLGTARSRLATIGTQTEALTFGGATSPTSTNTAASEEYNGSGFSVGGNLNTARRLLGGAGTQTAGLAFAGLSPASPNLSVATEEYGGTSWTNVNNIGTARYGLAGAGTQTAGLGFGGYQPPASPPNGNSVATEEYDGTNWSAGGNLNTGLYLISGTGTQTAALGFGGNLSTATEEYNGSSWTTSGTLNAGRSGAGAAGTQTAASGFGGELATPAITAQTELYDGTSWATSANMATGRLLTSGSGTQPAGLCVGGGVPAASNATEEFNITANTITAATWASGGNMATSKQDGAGFGIQTAAIGAGGYVSGYTNNAQSYDGSSWTAIPNINTTRSCRGLGTQTSGLIHAGNTPGDTPSAAAESWNGSSWTSVNSMNTARASVFSMGTFTSGLIAGGGPSSATETWDGTNWTSNPSNINTTRRGGMSAGTTSAGLIATGDPLGGSPNPETSNATEEWDGSSWTSGNNTITERNGARGFGLQTFAVITSGFNSGATVQYTTSEVYDGTNWATYPSISSGRGNTQEAGVGSPTTSSGMIFGGFIPGYFTATEEFTDETTSLNLKTITDS